VKPRFLFDRSFAACYTQGMNRIPGWEGAQMHFTVESEQEEDGRWLAEVLELPGVLAYGKTERAAIAKAEALALRVLADRLEHGEAIPDGLSISFAAA
jgi:predicted RNase H-like HicB family nuclease